MEPSQTESSLAPNKEGAGILIRKRRILSQEGNRCYTILDPSLSERELSHEASSFDYCATGPFPSTSSASTLRKKCADRYYPEIGDICTIQYRCYLLQSKDDGHRQTRKLVQCTKCLATDQQQGPVCASLLKDRSEICPPLEFEIGKGHVLRGLETAVQRMVPSNDVVYDVIMPHLYAYGDRGHFPIIPPRSDLFFEIILQKVEFKSSNPRCYGWFTSIIKVIVRNISGFWAKMQLWNSHRLHDHGDEEG
ncbi:FKBP-type peptidyl-prolyl cis-trans isomerase [Nitzschia inconspicua]|uniref:peptidylprolyl isomerase n=1 Tax=Nitzschia inconspicua TaxID=303405 RepID=A0A9K3PJ92_9STRA|nr:FKBP-type peptidyl-prolyl cis-trans isomerase [Nitzschia inconspicua]